MARAVMPHEHHVVIEIEPVKLRERSPRAERVEYLHRLCVLDLVLAGYRNPASCEQGTSENDRTHGVRVLGRSCAFVIVSQRSQIMLAYQAIQRSRRARRAFQLTAVAAG